MSELLPCPACGYTGVIPQRKRGKNGSFLLCGRCKTQGPVCSDLQAAVDAWNAMPRGYARTTEPPSTDGWYFTRVMEPGKPWRVFYVKKDGTKSQSQGYMLACETMESEYGWVIADNSENREWAGPIPMPTDRG